MRAKIFLTFLLIIFSTIIFSGCGGEELKKITSIDDLKNAKIGAWSFSAYELNAQNFLPNAQYVHFDNLSDLVENLKQHKIDAFVIGKSYFYNLQMDGVKIDALPQNLGDVQIGYVFPKNAKGEKLRTQMNEFIQKEKSNGTVDALKLKWFESPEDQRTFEKSALTGENGTLIAETDALSAPPFIYLRGKELVGFEVELFDKFCAEYGYNYEFKINSFETMLIDVSLGKIDIGINGIEILPEREESVLFSTTTFTNETVAIINSENAGGENFFEEIKSRAEKTLIPEDRWKMFFDGAITTLFITVLSIIFGTLLGFAVYMLYRENFSLPNKIINFAVRTLQGLPTVVMLLFFYYVIFGNVQIAPSIVAVIVFSIILAVSVFIILKSGAESISKGQMEAALSLGFSKRRAFIKFILPQIVKNFFQPYQQALNITLLETAIVGYIAVQDLTKMADLIRARTYDALIPIILIALIYLLLSTLLMKITDRISRRLNPKNRKREEILKGVKL